MRRQGLHAAPDGERTVALSAGNVTITAAGAQAYSLPFYLGPNKSLIIESGWWHLACAQQHMVQGLVIPPLV